MIVSQSRFFRLFLYLEKANKNCTGQKVKDDKDYERQVEQKNAWLIKKKKKYFRKEFQSSLNSVFDLYSKTGDKNVPSALFAPCLFVQTDSRQKKWLKKYTEIVIGYLYRFVSKNKLIFLKILLKIS